MAAMLTCSLDLRPLVLQQSVEHHTGMNVEGRRFSANCTVGRGSDLRLSNKLPLKELPVDVLIFETTRMPAELATLPQERRKTESRPRVGGRFGRPLSFAQRPQRQVGRRRPSRPGCWFEGTARPRIQRPNG